MNHVKELIDFSQPTQAFSAPTYFLYGEDRSEAIFGFFHIEELVVRNTPHKQLIAPHRHLDFDQLSILFNGHCTFEHDGASRSVQAPNCVYTPANVVHQFCYSAEAVGFVISVSPDFVVGLPSIEGAANTVLLRLASERLVTFESDQQLAMLRNLLELISEKAAAHHPYRRDALRYLFGSLLLELGAALMSPARRRAPQASASELDILKRYRELIGSTLNVVGFTNDHKTGVFTVEFLAQCLSVTPYALNLACQHVCGFPARDLLQASVLEQATRLLIYTTKPVKEISFLLGYSHASHFARFFKQRRGTTPEAFRKARANGSVERNPASIRLHNSMIVHENEL